MPLSGYVNGGQEQNVMDDRPLPATLPYGGDDTLIGSDSSPPSDTYDHCLDQDGDVHDCTTTTTTTYLPSSSSPGSTVAQIVSHGALSEAVTTSLGSSSSLTTNEKNKEASILQPLPMEASYRLPWDSLSFSRQYNFKDSFYSKGKSSRSPELSSSFTSRDTTNSTGTNSLDDNRLPYYHKGSTFREHQSSFSTRASITSPTVPQSVTNNSPNSTTRNSPPPANQNYPIAPSPNPSDFNAFHQLELPKYLLGTAIAFLTAVLIIHFSHPKTITREMTIVIVLLLSTGITFLWSSIMLVERYPAFARWFRYLGYSCVWGAISVFISCFLWPSYFFLASIACWVIVVMIIGIQASN